MSSDEPTYAQCTICREVFRLEVLIPINVAGVKMRPKACKGCVAEADARSGIEK